MAAIAEVNDDALEIDGAATHTQLNGPESSVVPPDVDTVVVLSSIHVSVSETVPTALVFPILSM